MTELVATENPEEAELRRKKEELAVLENELADLELEAAALLADTQAFLDTVTSAVAPKLLERDLLRAKLDVTHGLSGAIPCLSNGVTNRHKVRV